MGREINKVVKRLEAKAGRGKKEGEEKQGDQVGWIDPEEAPKEKRFEPFFPGAGMTQVNTKTADHKKDRHAHPAKRDR